MKDLITDTVLAVLANPAAARFEMLTSDIGIARSGLLITAVLAGLGVDVVEFGGADDPRLRQERIVFSSGISGPMLESIVAEDDQGEVWITFAITDAPHSMALDQIAA